MERFSNWRKAGFYLAFFILGCEQPGYRLDGQVPVRVQQVALLDSAAAVVFDSILAAYENQRVLLAQGRQAALDSLTQGAEALSGPIVAARRDCEAAEEKYARGFARLSRFRSFGGNPIFRDEDRHVNTQTMLAEIADRFYKGRAFSLETERELRDFIRQTLQPLEREVLRTKGRLAHLSRSKSNRVEDQAKVDAAFEADSRRLLEATNREILTALNGRQIATAAVDSTGYYRFERLPPATYHVFAPHPLPRGYLVPVTIAGHTRQDLGAENARRLQIEETLGEG